MGIQIEALTSQEILGLEEDLCSSEFQPLYFIKGLNPKPIHSHLLHLLADRNKDERDLCFRFKDPKNTLLILAEYLPWDSNHFGFGVARISYINVGSTLDSEFTSKAMDLFLGEARKLGIKYIFSSLDVRRKAEIHTLAECKFIPIEFRAHYHTDLRKFSYPKRFKVRLAAERDLETLSDCAANTQNPYDRFFGDPTLDPATVKDLMRVWVRNSILTPFADGVLVPNMENPKAFCTFKTHKEKWNSWGVKLAQPILAAVAPELSGWYVKVMSELSYFLKEAGAEKAYMTTQLANLSVIRTWEALDYQYGGSEIVLRWREK